MREERRSADRGGWGPRLRSVSLRSTALRCGPHPQSGKLAKASLSKKTVLLVLTMGSTSLNRVADLL